MAGLDPAAAATRQLVEQLLLRKGSAAQQHRISFDDFMKVTSPPAVWPVHHAVPLYY